MEIVRISSGQQAVELSDNVVLEQPVTIMIDQVGSFTVMATPCDIEALAVGFIFSEGLIDSIDQVVDIVTKPQAPNVVGIKVQDPSRIAIKRNMIVASSCGMCGTRNIEKMLAEMPSCGESLTVSSSLLIKATEKLRAVQDTFQRTGGSHAAAVFDSSGQFIAVAEDLGRHSALDKAIGKCLIDKLPTQGRAVVLSGRVSLEMVSKSARAGIELIAAVSAVSSLAVEAARKWNITLCGFVRQDKINIYTYPQRVTDANALSE